MAGALTAGLLLFLGLLTLSLRRRKYRLPPGPRGLPIVGNIRDVPQSFEWLTYQKWGRVFNSDILHFRVFGTTVIVLNSAKAARDLLEKRSKLYSDRENMVMLLDLVGWERSMAFIGYGDKWREHRRMFHQHFNPAAVQKYHPRTSQEVKKLLGRLIAQPDDFMQHIRTMTGSIILGITFGIDVQPQNDPHIVLAETALQSMAAVGNVGSYMVDYLPLLQYLPNWAPGAQFKRDAAEWKKSVVAMYEKPFQFVKRGLAEGNAPPSIAASLLAKLGGDQDAARRESVIRHVTGTAYVAGADTTVSSLGTFILAMLLHPEIQKAAQEQVDRVTGQDRLPEFEDKAALPIVTALMMETLRWRPVTPLAAPHKLIADDEYEGYDLPGGSIIVGNTWAILHDEERYPNPDAFDPTRYLTPEGVLDRSAPDPTVDAAFGFGRRICVGRHFAMDSLWIAIAYILATLDIQKAVDEAGNVVEPSGEYTPGLISYPAPFRASFKPRTPSALAIIQSSD